MGKTGLAPNAVLVDDLPHDHGLAQLKSRVLGIGTERFYQIPSFTGHSTENAHSVVQGVKRFFERVSNLPQKLGDPSSRRR